MKLELNRKESSEGDALVVEESTPRSQRTPHKNLYNKNRANRGVARKPFDGSMNLDFAEMALAGGNPRHALTLTARILEEDPMHLPALELTARAQWQCGELEQLRSTIMRMISLNPYEPGYFSLLGAVEQSRGRIGLAIQALNRCIRLSTNPDPAAILMREELQKYQSTLLATLIAEDPAFRALYRKNPVSAARARGFEIESPTSDSLTPVNASPSLLFARPS